MTELCQRTLALHDPGIPKGMSCSYHYTGDMPCTGRQVCHLCGKEKPKQKYMVSVSDLILDTLDYAVAKALNLNVEFDGEVKCKICNTDRYEYFSPSTLWKHGGGLLEVGKFNLNYDGICWNIRTNQGTVTGFTALEAVCKATVLVYLGSEIELPKDVMLHSALSNAVKSVS